MISTLNQIFVDAAAAYVAWKDTDFSIRYHPGTQPGPRGRMVVGIKALEV